MADLLATLVHSGVLDKADVAESIAEVDAV